MLLEAVEAATIFDLEQLRYAGAPSHPAHMPGFNYFLHRHHARGAPEARTGASGIIVTPEHSGTHIDALAHQAENLTLYGGVHVDEGVQTSAGFKKLGIETMAPLVGADIGRPFARSKLRPYARSVRQQHGVACRHGEQQRRTMALDDRVDVLRRRRSGP